MDQDITIAIAAHARTAGLDVRLVTGLVRVESGGNRWAWNPEQRYRYYWDVQNRRPFRAVTGVELASEYAPPDFHSAAGDPDQEWWAQSASWGLCQIMGAVAREHGFPGPYLTALCDADTNLVLACRHLAALLQWSSGNTTRALAAYNGGKVGNAAPPYRNAAYAQKVLAAMAG